MAWYNPSTWTPVDNLQNSISSTSYSPIHSGTTSGFSSSPSGGQVYTSAAPAPAPIGPDPQQLANDYTAQSAYDSSGVPAPPPDPYAQWGGQANYNGLMDQFNTQHQNIIGSANDWASNYGIGLKGNITDYINNLRQGQQGLDEQGVQNELSLKQGRSGILGMVSRGIQSGGVTLANRNAADSSAAAALANAYGEIGRGQLSNIGNQYALADRNLGLQQGNFDVQKQAGARKIQDSETQDVSGAVAQARNQLASLDAWAADKSLPERLAVEQEKSNISASIDNLLGGNIQDLNSGVAGINAQTVEQRRATASGLATAGTVPTNPFDFTSQTPLQLQGSGPTSGNLPLYTQPKKRQ